MTATESVHPPVICCGCHEALKAIRDHAKAEMTIETVMITREIIAVADAALTGKWPLHDPAKLITTSDELRAWRALHRWTQQHAARMLGVGYATYRGYENGANIPKPIALLCEFVRRHGPMEISE